MRPTINQLFGQASSYIPSFRASPHPQDGEQHEPLGALQPVHEAGGPVPQSAHHLLRPGGLLQLPPRPQDRPVPRLPEMLEVQLAVASLASSHAQPMYSEMVAMKQHYERQLTALTEELDRARGDGREPGTGSGQPGAKRKKVSAASCCRQPTPSLPSGSGGRTPPAGTSPAGTPLAGTSPRCSSPSQRGAAGSSPTATCPSATGQTLFICPM